MQHIDRQIHRSPAKIAIIGGGRFGRQAAVTLRRRYPSAFITLVDINPVEEIAEVDLTICDDGVSWLAKEMKLNVAMDIIPALPVHLAFEWLKAKLAEESYTTIPVEIPPGFTAAFPHPFPLQVGQMAISHADFICPPDCPEPAGYCTHTGLPRPTPLFKIAEEVRQSQVVMLVLRSRQFGPGVGGYSSEDLMDILRKAREAFGAAGKTFAVCTSCRCHGIIDIFEIRKSGR